MFQVSEKTISDLKQKIQEKEKHQFTSSLKCSSMEKCEDAMTEKTLALQETNNLRSALTQEQKKCSCMQRQLHKVSRCREFKSATVVASSRTITRACVPRNQVAPSPVEERTLLYQTIVVKSWRLFQQQSNIVPSFANDYLGAITLHQQLPKSLEGEKCGHDVPVLPTNKVYPPIQTRVFWNSKYQSQRHSRTNC